MAQAAAAAAAAACKRFTSRLAAAICNDGDGDIRRRTDYQCGEN